MNMKIVNKGDAADVLLIGRLDVIAAPEVEKALIQTSRRFNDINLDLSKLEYISSAGLRALKNFFMAMMAKNAHFSVSNIPKPIMDIFEATGFAFFL